MSSVIVQCVISVGVILFASIAAAANLTAAAQDKEGYYKNPWPPAESALYVLGPIASLIMYGILFWLLPKLETPTEEALWITLTVLGASWLAWRIAIAVRPTDYSR